MQLTFEHRGKQYRFDTREAVSLAIKMDFDGPQPNHFGTDKASRSVLKLGEFTGDTAQGGSCNVDTLSMIPHCNGTHTETVSHIVNQDIWIGHAAMDPFCMAMLVTVRPESSATTTDSYRPKLEPTDTIISAESLRQAMQVVGDVDKIKPSALIVRTLPNQVDKCSRAYVQDDQPPFFSVEAMAEINRINVRHLLVDFPSVDRMYDEGLLTNHHLYWNVPEKTHELSGESWQDKTITEMVYVDDDVRDGIVALNLQLPAFCSDAAPSRPVIFPLASR